MEGGDQQLNFPAGFRFHPTDEELVVHYLCRKCADQQISAPVIAEIDIYKFDPWELPGMAVYGEKEWYFFSPRDRKYPNGSRPNRSAGNGYWKATGADKPVGKPKTLGIKKALVFYAGKAPNGVKTNWILHEYRLANVDRTAGKRKNLRLDDWVLCRLYNKKGTLEKHYNVDQKEVEFSNSEEQEEPKPKADPAFAWNGMMASQMVNEFLHLDTSHESINKWHAYSSSSEHVLSSEFIITNSSDPKEVQSEPKWSEFPDFQLDYTGGFEDEDDPQLLQYNNDHLSLFQDMFAHSQRPFYLQPN